MAKVKKIRFPLEMENGIMVRTLEELQEHFSLEKVLMYISNGKLQIWLRDRYLDDIAENLLQLNQDTEYYAKNVCNAFGVEYDEKSTVDLESVIERQRKISLLKTYTDDESYFAYIDQMAFEQDDLYDLLDEEFTTIYLCGEKFSIPISKRGVRYVGVNTPIGVIASKETVNFVEREISFKNIVFDKNYQNVLEEYEKQQEKAKTAFGEYISETYLKTILSEEEQNEAKKCYETLSILLENINYEEEADIEKLRNYLLETGLETWGECFF